MANPCKYKLAGQDTWMSEDEFKKSLADGLLDKFVLDNNIKVPGIFGRNVKVSEEAAQKFRAPITETTTKAEEVTPTTETKAETTPKTENPTIEKVERKGALEVEAETRNGNKVTYKAEVNEDGKTATVQQTYEAPFGGETEGSKVSNLPIKTDSKGNRYVETKNETKVYIDKVKEAPKVEEKTKEEKRATVTISPSRRVSNAPNITFTKNNRTGKWETTDKAGNKFEANEDQAERAEEAFKEQQKQERNKRERENRAKSKEKVERAFDSLKIPKDRAFSIPIPVDLYNKIIELAKRSVLAGVDVATAIKDATSQVLEKRKSQKLISEEEAKKVEDYTSSKDFTDKVNEATKGQERVSGIKIDLTSEKSKILSEDMLDRMGEKEALDAGKEAIESGKINPEELIDSIIESRGKSLEPIEVAAMVYYKAKLDNDTVDAYNELDEATESKDGKKILDAKSKIAKIEDKQLNYELMSNLTRYNQGLSLRLRRLMVNSEFNLVKIKAKIKSKYGNKLPKDVEERLNNIDEKFRSLTSKINQKEKEKEKLESTETVNTIKKDKDYKSNESKSVISKDGKISVPIKLIRQAVENGATKIEDVIDSVRESVKEKFPSATDRQIRDAITNYAKTINNNKSELNKKISQIKRIGRLLSELEDLQSGIKKQKNETEKYILSDREKDLKQKIKEALSKIPLTEEEIQKIKEDKLESLKDRLNKSLEDLSKKIKEGNFEKKTRNPFLDLDEEARKLKVEREKLKWEYDKEVAKAERAAKLKNKYMKPILKILEGIGKAINTPKGLIASIDFSAPFNQGYFALTTQSPLKSAKQIKDMFKFWVSKNAYENWLAEVKTSEYYPLMKASGLYIAETNAKLSAAEEGFVTGFLKHIPILGHPIKSKDGKLIFPGLDLYERAERAYVGFLNNLRVQSFLDMTEALSDSGLSPIKNADEYKSAGLYINNMTGRGTGNAAFEMAAPALALALFSPRNIVSKAKLMGLDPSMYYKMSPASRRIALKRLATFIGVNSVIIGLAAAYFKSDDDDNTDVELDLRSSDFGKLKLGDVRIDLAGGFQQQYRTAIQFLGGYKKNIFTQEIKKLGVKYGDETRLDVATKFFNNKLAPTTKVLINYLDKTEQEKQSKERKEGKTTIQSSIYDLTVPIWMHDLNELNEQYGPVNTSLLTVLNIMGMKVENYQENPLSIKNTDNYFDSIENIDVLDNIDELEDFEDIPY